MKRLRSSNRSRRRRTSSLPVSGSVSAVNEELNDTPELVNSDPYGAWFLKIEVEDGTELDKLMDADAYSAFVDSQQ